MLDVATQSGVGAAEDFESLALEFVLGAVFADYEDAAFVLGEVEDARDVDGG